MSHNITLIDTTHSGQPVEVYRVRFADSYSGLLQRLGLDLGQYQGERAGRLGIYVNAAVVYMALCRAECEPLIWGDGCWDDVAVKLMSLASACKVHHAATVKVS